MGGPFWAGQGGGRRSIPKGEYAPEEAPWDAARREFAEEIGQPPPDATPIELGSITQRNGKVVTAYALEGDLDPDSVVSNTFEMEWPRGSGRRQSFPEIDRVAWFSVADSPAQDDPEPARAAGPPRGAPRSARSNPRRGLCTGRELVCWGPGRAHAGYPPGGPASKR